MKIIDANTVYLETGETIPVFCRCGHIYQPTENSECSDCPGCGRVNHHQHSSECERRDDDE
jgi:hypothetical protein